MIGTPSSSSSSGPVELAEVTSVKDPDGLGRVEVRFLFRGPEPGQKADPDTRDAKAWALVAVPFAGNGNGGFLIPDVGTRVVIGFLQGDTRFPVVLGSVWTGATRLPERLGGDGSAVDRWSFTGKGGTRVAIVEDGGSSKIELKTRAGHKVVLDDGGGSITLSAGASSITLTGGKIRIDSPEVEISASTFKTTATIGTFDIPIADFSAFVMCELMQSSTVVSTTYTPGAGNMW